MTAADQLYRHQGAARHGRLRRLRPAVRLSARSFPTCAAATPHAARRPRRPAPLQHRAHRPIHRRCCSSSAIYMATKDDQWGSVGSGRRGLVAIIAIAGGGIVKSTGALGAGPTDIDAGGDTVVFSAEYDRVYQRYLVTEARWVRSSWSRSSSWWSSPDSARQAVGASIWFGRPNAGRPNPWPSPDAHSSPPAAQPPRSPLRPASATPPARRATTPAARRRHTVDFHGAHQAGIATPAQDRLHFAAFDVTDGTSASSCGTCSRSGPAASVHDGRRPADRRAGAGGLADRAARRHRRGARTSRPPT